MVPKTAKPYRGASVSTWMTAGSWVEVSAVTASQIKFVPYTTGKMAQDELCGSG